MDTIARNILNTTGLTRREKRVLNEKIKFFLSIQLVPRIKQGFIDLSMFFLQTLYSNSNVKFLLF
jgi:hypothetical protein